MFFSAPRRRLTSTVRLQFYKPVHDFLTDESINGKYDMPPHGVLVIDERLH